METAEKYASWHKERESLRKAVTREKWLNIVKHVAASVGSELKLERECEQYALFVVHVNAAKPVFDALKSAFENEFLISLENCMFDIGCSCGLYHKGDPLLSPISLVRNDIDDGFSAFYYPLGEKDTQVCFRVLHIPF